jgi:hypothetical protein
LKGFNNDQTFTNPKLYSHMTKDSNHLTTSLMSPLKLSIYNDWFMDIYRKLNVANFNKELPRDDKLTMINLTPSNYNTNFEYLMPKLSK